MSLRLLVLRGGALGDFILGLPALQALRKAFPDALVQLIAPRAVLPLASSIADLTVPIELAENAALFGDAKLPAALVERYQGLDLAVLWLADPDGTVRRNFEGLGARRVLQAPALPPKGTRVHATDYLLATLEPLGINIAGVGGPTPSRAVGRVACPPPPGQARSAAMLPTWTALTPTLSQGERENRDASHGEREKGGLSHGESEAGSTAVSAARPRGAPASRPSPVVLPSTDAVERATIILRDLGLSPSDPLVAIHPGSGGRWKCWPPERFARSIESLAASGMSPVLVQGPADDEVVAAVLAEIQGRRAPVVANLPVEDLAALLSQCSAYLGNDSGVTHLAAAVGTPTVALFGPTDPAVWGPRGSSVAIIRGNEGRLEAISVAQVAATLLARGS